MNNIGIIGNEDRPQVRETLVLLLTKLADRFPGSTIALSEPMAALSDSRDCQVFASHYDLARFSDIIFSIGGDGTMLMASRAIQRANHKAELIGVNVGKLGFLSEHPPEELDQLLEELSGGTLLAEQRLMLHAAVRSERGDSVTINRDNLDLSREGTQQPKVTLDALNEVVVDNYGSTRMLQLEVFVGSALLGIIRADGIMVATPTGSTGYAVSAGGPIVEPTSPVMLITPIAPHSLNVRPIIVSQEATIRIRCASDETSQVLIVADGQEQIIASTPAEIIVQAAPNPLKLLRRRERSYFDLLRTKLFWSADRRDVGRR